MSQAEKSWVYVVDDDPHVLKAVQRLLCDAGYNVSAFGSSRAFLNAHDPALPGCVLLDVGMSEMTGLETQKELLALGSTKPVIFVTGSTEVQTGVMAMKAGARDYLIKPVPDTVLLEAVAAAVQSDLATRCERSKQAELAEAWQSLTGREREVMIHMACGQRYKHIAFELKLAIQTVKMHRARVMEKMGARCGAELLHFAEQLARAGYMSNADNAGRQK